MAEPRLIGDTVDEIMANLRLANKSYWLDLHDKYNGDYQAMSKVCGFPADVVQKTLEAITGGKIVDLNRKPVH